MNFFKQISSAVDKINSIGNLTHQKNFTNPKPDPLMELIRTCSYTDDVKFTIQKSVKQILQMYPSYIFDKLEYTEGGFQKRFIELKGEIHVELRGKIRLHIMYPATFPKNAPYLRIINPNTNEFAPTMMYLPLQSKTDTKSYVLNEKLESVKKWNSSTSVVSLILEANNLIKANFPFQPISQMSGGSWGNNQINQGFSQQQNQYPSQYNQYNQGFGQNVKQPPIPFQAGNYASYYPKAHALVTTQRKKVQELKLKHQPLLANIQSLSAATYAIQSQSYSLHTQNQKMLSFVNSGYDNQEVDLLQVVVPSDLLSKQILELTSSIKGREDTIHFLESKFNDQEISLEVFMKNLRKMEEGKFQEKALLIKCLQNVSRIHA